MPYSILTANRLLWKVKRMRSTLVGTYLHIESVPESQLHHSNESDVDKCHENRHSPDGKEDARDWCQADDGVVTPDPVVNLVQNLGVFLANRKHHTHQAAKETAKYAEVNIK